MDTISINVGPNSEDLEKVFQKIYSAVADTEPILDEVAAFLFNRIRTNFLKQTAPDGTKWVVSQAALNRARTGRGGGTLFDTGNLWRSIQLAAIGTNERAITTDVPYGPYHNFGLGNMPVRAFMGFGPQDASIANKLMVKRFKEAFKNG